MRVNERMKKLLSIVLTLCMVLSYIPAPAYAVGTDCTNHTEHTADCGYVAAVEGVPCAHEHDENCGYVEAVAEVLCACEATDENGVIVHTEGCGYVAAVPGSDCAHVHDDACGYVQAVKGSDCTFVCTECKAEEKTCTCESTDPGEHAPFCDLYVRTYEGCTCVLSCAEEGLNDWCEACHFGGVEACTGGEEEQIAYATSGIIGSLSWKLDDNGVLTISGEGNIPNRAISNFEDKESITNAIIEQGVTTIGNSAFRGCTGLESVTIPSSVTKIETNAFYNCSSLTTVNYLGESRPNFERNTFGRCSSLEAVNVPAGYDSDTFGGLPVKFDTEATTYTVTFHLNGYGTAIPQQTVTENGKVVKPEDPTAEGYIFAGWYADQELTTEWNFETNTVTDDTDLYAKWTVTCEHDWDTYTGICGYCSETHGDHEYTWTDGACSVCGVVGGYCGYTGDETLVEYVLTSENEGITYTITISGTGRMGEYNTASYDTTKQPWKDYCNKITTAVVNSGVQDVGWGAFQNHTKLTSVSIPDSITTIGSMAFSGTTSLRSVTLPSALTSLGSNAFYNSGIQSITIPAGVTKIEYNTFQKSKLSSINLGNVTTIDTSAFRDCKQLTSVTLPGTLVTIGTDAFNGSNLTSVTIPSSVTKIGERAFQGCNALKTVSISGGDLNVMQQAFWSDDALETLTITNTGTVTLGKRAFALQSGEQDKLNSITLPQNVIFTDSYADVFEYRRTPVTGVSLDKTEMTVYIGNSEKLTATVEPGTATNKKVTWSSSDNNIATVDSNGNVTGVSAGAATITVTTVDGGKTAACTVTVPAHTHNWTYTAEGATITATCTSANCPNTDGGSVTIYAPKHSVYGDGKEEQASYKWTMVYPTTGSTIFYEKKTENGTWENITQAPTDAGTYKASLTVDIIEKTISVEYTIEKAAPVITWDSTTASTNYTGSEAVITAPVITLANGETFNGTISYSYTGTSSGNGLPTNAGTYEITASIDTYGNYNAATSSNTLELTINKVDPSYTVPTGLTATYGDTLADVALPDGFSWANSTESVGAVGTKNTTVIYTPADTTNYNTVTNIEVSVEVKAAAATVTKAPTANTLTYTGSAQDLINAGSANGGKLVYSLSEDGEFIETIPAGTNAGEYTVWYYVVGDDNHADSAKGSVKVTITKAKATITVDTTTINITYGETVTLPEATTNFGTVTCDKIAADLVNAGTYTVTYTVAGTDNYDGDTKTLTVKVEKKAVAEPTITGTYTYTGSEQTVALTGVESYMTVASGNKGTNAGNHEVEITLDNNHKWADGSDGKVQWSIGKAQAGISVNTDTITVTYGETVTLPTATANFGTVSCDKTAADLVNAGTYTVTYTVEGTTNFEGDTKSITVIVNAKSITVTADAVSKTYGEADPTLTYKVEGLVNGDELTGELKRVAGENVGDYAIEQNTLTAGNNYRLTYTGAELTVNKRDVVITAKDQTITYGETISGAEITAAGLVDGHSVTMTLTPSTANVTANGTITASAAAITADGTDVTDNYEITYTGGKLVIEPDTSRIDTLSTENVTSANEEDIKAVQEMMEDADSTKEEWETIPEKCEALLDRIAEVEAEQKETTNEAATFDEDTVKSTDKENLEQLAKDIEDLLDTDNLTEDEREALETVLEQVEGMIDTIEDTAEDSKVATEKIDALDPATVTSDDKDELEQAIETIDKLLTADHLTEDERKALEDAKADAEGLIEKIKAAQDATDTENTEKVEDVTADNVKPEDKEALEDAKADLEKALEDNASNYTEEEKQAIQDEIQRIDDAMVALENVEDVTDAITQLPETVEPDDEEVAEKILDAKEAYDELTDHEKSLVDEDTKKKLDNLVASLTAYDIIKGDGGKWTKGGSSGLTFTANGPFSKFVGIEVDGKEVDEKYYDAKSGSTIITLKQSYLKRLSTGEHTITVLYTDGETSGTFKILAESYTPATGDDSNIMLYGSMFTISLVAIVVLLLASKKRKQETA